MEKIVLYPYQKEAVSKLHSGSILCGGVGTGKSITALAYYLKVCGGYISDKGALLPPAEPMDLYIITTARKRDTFEWDNECARYDIFTDSKFSRWFKANLVIDSWNNIKKYEVAKSAFFIFDEQRVVGAGTWSRSFIKIARNNHWILLSATPGDTWMDYIPVFVANGFYKNRTQFLLRHAVYNRYSKYPKVDHFLETGHLEELRRRITVVMTNEKKTVPHHVDVPVLFSKEKTDMIMKQRWDPFEDCPIQNILGVCYLLRRVANEDPSRIEAIKDLMKVHAKMIIFYNFDYELAMLKALADEVPIAEWNGHKHEPIPDSDRWLYLVQYTAGAEGWNCTDTDTVIFYSQNYSYKLMTQAAGRIDRLNTKFHDLYYYHLKSEALIDRSIEKALKSKSNFNARSFILQNGLA